jgi:hypothetical protein
MSVKPVERTRPAQDCDEITTLAGVLDFLRATVVNKVAGLSDEDARQASAEPSTLTPASVVKHLSAVERWWFSIDFANADIPEPEGINFDLATDDTLDSIVEAYLTECERSRRAISGESPDELSRGKDVYFNLRYALVHMIEETARHCGHLDLLRERIDGETGE